MGRSSTFALLGVWFAACSGLILWFGASAKSQFDPNLKLSQHLMSLSFEDKVVSTLLAASVSESKTPLGQDAQLHNGATIFHISQNSCYCDWLAQAHQNSLDKWAKQNDFASVHLNLHQARALQDLIPSTPAVVAIDENQELIYLGPYSRGSGCFTQSGKIDEQLANWKLNKASQAVYYGGAIIDTDASGCYCNFDA